MPQIDEMDGVPEEPGFYLIKHEPYLFNSWSVAIVEFSEFGVGIDVNATIWTYDGVYTISSYSDFEEYKWSEKIEPPE